MPLEPRSAARYRWSLTRHGLRPSFGTIASVGLLETGLWVVPWYSTDSDDAQPDKEPIAALASDHAFVPVTAEIVHGISGALALVTLAAGAVLGLFQLDDTAPPFGGAAGRGRAPSVETAPPFGGAAGRGRALLDNTALGPAALGRAVTRLVPVAPDGIHHARRGAPCPRLAK